ETRYVVPVPPGWLTTPGEVSGTLGVPSPQSITALKSESGENGLASVKLPSTGAGWPVGASGRPAVPVTVPAIGASGASTTEAVAVAVTRLLVGSPTGWTPSVLSIGMRTVKLPSSL